MVAASTGFDLALVATAFALGFRHGFDWDHIAALSDIAASQESRRRSIALATLYALGHAAVAFTIGAVVVVASARLPSSVGEVMERVVGVTLVALGGWVIVTWASSGGKARIPSRGLLVLAAFGRLRRRPQLVVIEHEHEHPVTEPHVHDPQLVDHHAFEHQRIAAGRAEGGDAPVHRHRHTHVASVPDDPFPTYGAGVTLGIGMLHGVGFETPTQALVFVAAAGTGSRAVGVLVLACFLAGLLLANTLVAAASTLGLTGARSRTWLYTSACLLAAAASLALGLLYVAGRGDLLPS